jgi:hypothetical protein
MACGGALNFRTTEIQCSKAALQGSDRGEVTRMVTTFHFSASNRFDATVFERHGASRVRRRSEVDGGPTKRAAATKPGPRSAPCAHRWLVDPDSCRQLSEAARPALSACLECQRKLPHRRRTGRCHRQHLNAACLVKPIFPPLWGEVVQLGMHCGSSASPPGQLHRGRRRGLAWRNRA